MSTRYSTGKRYGRASINLGYEGSNVPDDLRIPSCGLEDVDRALFNLFDKDLPLLYQQKDGSTKKVPVIFATGERFAITRRKEPLRDKNGALILPMISIVRSGIEQQAQKSIDMGDLGTIDIKRRLSKDDPIYQRVVNSLGFNSVGAPADSSRRDARDRPGRMADGRLLEPNLGAGLYETISIPVPKFFTSTYEITLWTQFMQHSNEILTTIVSGYHNVKARSYRVETPVGYWFNAMFEASIASETTFDGMQDDERVIKHTMTVAIPAFIVAPSSPGIPSGIRRTVSAPQISFGIINKTVDPEPSGNVQDMRISSLLLDPIATVDGPVPLGSIGVSPDRQAERAAGGNQVAGSSVRINPSAAVGGSESSSLRTRTTTRTLTEDPITGKEMDVVVRVRSVSATHGEEVLTTVRKTARADKDLK